MPCSSIDRLVASCDWVGPPLFLVGIVLPLLAHLAAILGTPSDLPSSSDVHPLNPSDHRTAPNCCSLTLLHFDFYYPGNDFCCFVGRGRRKEPLKLMFFRCVHRVAVERQLVSCACLVALPSAEGGVRVHTVVD